MDLLHSRKLEDAFFAISEEGKLNVRQRRLPQQASVCRRQASLPSALGDLTKMDKAGEELDDLPWLTSVFCKAVDRYTPNDAAPFVGSLSISAAKKQVDFLLTHFAVLDNLNPDPSKRCCLDEVVVLILDGKGLLASDVVSSDDLICWLRWTYSHWFERGRSFYVYPLFGVINRLMRFVNDAEEIKKCFNSAVAHLHVKGLEHGHTHLNPSENVRFLQVIFELLKRLDQLEEGNCLDQVKEVLACTDKHIWDIPKLRNEFCSVLECTAGILRRHPITRDKAARDLLTLHNFVDMLLAKIVMSLRNETIILGYRRWISSMCGKRCPHVCERAEAIAEETEIILRRSIEVGLFPLSCACSRLDPFVHRSVFFTFALCDFVLALAQEHHNKHTVLISSLVKVAIWLSASGARLASSLSGRRLFKAVRDRIPALAQVVYLRVPRLQQICARTIRQNLRGSISEMSRKLPLPVVVQSYVVRDFLDDDLWRVESLVESITEIKND